MIIDPKTGMTLQRAVNIMSNIFKDNKDSILALKDSIDNDYEVSDEVLDALEHKEQYTPDDIRTLARAVGMDYELLTSKELPEDFNDRFCTAVDNLYMLRNKYRPKKGE